MNTSQQTHSVYPQLPTVSTANTVQSSLQGAMDDVLNPPPSYTKESEPNGYQYQYLAEPSSSSASYLHVVPAAPPSTTAGTIPSAPELNCPDLKAHAFDPESHLITGPRMQKKCYGTQWNQAVAETV
ncbi:hypothetical protein BS47DRAFT_1335973, partial [Hydnum rufescens UP504]